MELIFGFMCLAGTIFIAGYELWFLKKPKAVKKIGNRRWYVKWNKER